MVNDIIFSVSLDSSYETSTVLATWLISQNLLSQIIKHKWMWFTYSTMHLSSLNYATRIVKQPFNINHGVDYLLPSIWNSVLIIAFHPFSFTSYINWGAVVTHRECLSLGLQYELPCFQLILKQIGQTLRHFCLILTHSNWRSSISSRGKQTFEITRMIGSNMTCQIESKSFSLFSLYQPLSIHP